MQYISLYFSVTKKIQKVKRKSKIGHLKMSNFGKPKKVSKMHHFSLFDHNGLNDFLCIAKFVMLIFLENLA